MSENKVSTQEMISELCRLLKALYEVLTKQELALLSRDAEEIMVYSGKCQHIASQIAQLTKAQVFSTALEKKGSCNQSHLQCLIINCQDKYQRNQRHLAEMSDYYQQLSILLFPGQGQRYSPEQCNKGKPVRVCGSLGLA